jgi:Bacterial Ig domain
VRLGALNSRTWLRALAVGLVAVYVGAGAHALGAATLRASADPSAAPVSIAWLSPRDGGQVRGVLQGSRCDVAVHDSTPITKVAFAVDGSTFRTDTVPPYTCDISSAQLSPGMHILTATAYDARGTALSTHVYVSTQWFGPPRTTVTVQGDSLTVGSWWEIPAYLGRRYDYVSYSAHWGRPSVRGLSLLRGQRLGRVVVFALGTNDWWAPPAAYRSHLSSVLHMIGPSRCLVLATIWRGGAPNRALNAILYAMARRYGPARIDLAHWAEAVASRRVRLSPDGTHPDTQAGWDGRAAIIASAIRACAAH